MQQRTALTSPTPRASSSLGARTVFALLTALALVGLASASARAELRIDITRGVVEPMPIAIPTFAANTPEEQEIAKRITEVVAGDLERTGLFRPLDPRAFLQDAKSLQANGPRWNDWRVINAQAVVEGGVEVTPNGLRVIYRLWDVLGSAEIGGTSFGAPAALERRIAHKVADEVYKRVTGEDGYFDTRVVYIAESGPANRRVKRLAIMDQDGANNSYLTDGQNLVLTPRFSPTSQEITYLSYIGNSPRVYLFNLDTRRQERLGDFPGMTFAPRFSPDGNAVVMSLAQNGNTEIYRMDLGTRRMRQLTNHPAIDTAPSYEPNGNRIVFESDRGGTQQLYVMNSDGSNPQRLTFGEGRYATPVWSPRGDLIAFTRLYAGQFYIGVIRPDGTGERMLSQAFHVEGPTWAPNGRVLMYFKEAPAGSGSRNRSAKLYSIDLTGLNERQVSAPTDASDPAWSPLLQ
jgi:TolB protein